MDQPERKNLHRFFQRCHSWSFCSNPLYHTLSKGFEISKATKLWWSYHQTVHIFYMTVKKSAVGQEKQSLYCSSLRRLFLVRKSMTSKSMLITLRRLIGWYCDGNEHSPAFLKAEQTSDTFNKLKKHFSLRQMLTTFPRLEITQGEG